MKRVGLLLLAALLAFAAACDDVDVSEDGIGATGTLPLVPFNLPFYPSDVTLDGLDSSLEDLADDYGVGWLFDNDSVAGAMEDVEDELRDASLEILQPGVLSVSADNQIAESIRGVVEVTKVGVNFEVSNDTEEMAAVPVEFQIFMGDGELAEAWDESVMIPFSDPRVDEDGKFIVEPGESIELSIDNVPHLVDALNESESFGVGYKSIYRVGDAEHGADLGAVIDVFGLCILSQFIGVIDGDCPSLEELVAWHLTVKKFELVISAEADWEIPSIEECSEFADEFGLDYLAEACTE